MRKFIIKDYPPLVVSLFFILIITFLWEHISLTYKENHNIVGNYSNADHHQFNDTLRFLIFILIPLASYLLTLYLVDKNNILSINQIVKQRNFQQKRTHDKNIFLLLVTFIFVLVLFYHFLLIDFPDYKLDVFHEGQLLTGAMNYNLKNVLWTGSYLNTGLFYDILNTKFAWLLFDKENISAYRFFQQILNYIFYFLIILFVLNISKIFYLDKNKRSFFFITVTSFCLFFYLVSYSHFPNYRDFFSIFFLILLSSALFNKNLSIFIFFLIGNLSILSLLWSLDRGVFLNATLIFVCFIFILQNKVKEIISLLSGILFSWLIFVFLVGPNEFYAFLDNSINILKFNELWNGIIHPTPFSDEKNSSRATKALLIIFINGIFILRFIFYKKNNIPIETKNFIVVFYVLAFFYYKVGLSRSDGGHIVIGSSLNYLLFFIFIIYKLLQIEFKNFRSFFKFNNIFLTIYLFTILGLFNLSFLSKNYDLKNIFSFNNRFDKFINLKDDFFIDDSYSNFYKQLKEITKNDNCIQTFNYDPTIYYLLKKSSCTKFYKTFVIASEQDQLTFINELKESKFNKIVIDTNKYGNLITPNVRFIIINDFIENNYADYIEINNFKILKSR